MLQKISESVEYIKKLFKTEPKTCVILGSGLGGFVEEIKIINTIAYSDIPHFEDTTIEGHDGELALAEIRGTQFLILKGRCHYYEGKSIDSIVYPIRVLKYLGIKNLLLSNASGGLNEQFSIGDLMLITDHINLIPNPLIGPHDPEFGERFPDMSEAYSKKYLEQAKIIAKQSNIDIKQGVYVSVTGPTYETPAEYRYFRIIGGDAVGMSTTPEVIVANQMGVNCFAISVITDLGVPGKIEFLNHEMVQKAAAKAEPKLARIFKEMIIELS